MGGRVMAIHHDDKFDILVDRTGVPGRDAERLAQAARKADFVATDVSVVSVVGTGLASRPSLYAEISKVLSAVACEILGTFITELALSVVVETALAIAAVKALHQALIIDQQ
jgi:aspartokinase